MSLVEEYYELNEAEMVPVAWKFIQIGTYVLAGCLGLWCAYTMNLIRTKFGDRCYLFTPHKANETSHFPVQIDWEGDLYCDYTQYVMVTSFILSTIWATFFLMCGKGGKSPTGLPQPWRIVFCSLIFNIIYFSLVLSASIEIQRGTEFFCKHPSEKTMVKECPPLKALHEDTNAIETTMRQLEIVVKSSWGCTFSWLILVLLPFIRIVFVIDFRLYKICVFQIDETTHNKKEEVLKITNYEEPRKLFYKDNNDSWEYISMGSIESRQSTQSMEDLERGTSSRKWNNFRRNRAVHANTAFYVTADIRMLNREKKRNKIKVLDEAFERSQALRSKKFIFPEEVTVNDSNVSPSTRLLHRYPKLVFQEGRNESDSEEEEESSSEEVLDKATIVKKQL